jgi:uncharacterized RDD family membrane protein YckC
MTSLSHPSDGLPGAPADKLTIETPEQTSLEFAVAGIGSRFLAMALDTLIQFACYAVLILAAFGLVRAFPGLDDLAGTWLVAAILVVFFGISFGYFIFFEALWNGQTPGKRIIRLRVIKDDGRPIHTGEAFGRNLLRIVDELPFLYAVGIACILFSKQSKRLGDFVAGTIVVHERTIEEIRPLWQAASESAGAQRFGSERLTGEELTLIEAFLNRRDALDADVRYNMAGEILRQVQGKLTLPPAGTLSNEKLLEAVASERRGTAKYA